MHACIGMTLLSELPQEVHGVLDALFERLGCIGDYALAERRQAAAAASGEAETAEGSDVKKMEKMRVFSLKEARRERAECSGGGVGERQCRRVFVEEDGLCGWLSCRRNFPFEEARRRHLQCRTRKQQ